MYHESNPWRKETGNILCDMKDIQGTFMLKGLRKKSMKPSLWRERENRREGQGHWLGYREEGIGESITVKLWNYALLTPPPQASVSFWLTAVHLSRGH